MAHIVRPGKTAGTHRYTEEVQLGADFIRETEVDGDLDTVYGEFNGGIDDTNIRDGASIDYSKLDLNGRIQSTDLVPGFQFPTGSNPLPPGSVDTPTLAPGASWQFAHQVGASVTLPYSMLTTSEVTLATITTSPASRNGLVWIFGMFSGWLAAPDPQLLFWGRLRAGGTQVAISTIVAGGTGASMQAPFQISCMSLPRIGNGATGPIILTGQMSIAGGPLLGTVAEIRDVQLIAIELA